MEDLWKTDGKPVVNLWQNPWRTDGATYVANNGATYGASAGALANRVQLKKKNSQ